MSINVLKKINIGATDVLVNDFDHVTNMTIFMVIIGKKLLRSEGKI